MTQVPEDDIVHGLAERLDPYMRRILDGSEDPHVVVGELMLTLTEPPYFEHLWGVGWLYQIWGELSDIVDGYPVDYGPDSDAIAARELRHAAQDWLGMPHTAVGLQDYVAGRTARLATLPTAGPFQRTRSARRQQHPR